MVALGPDGAVVHLTAEIFEPLTEQAEGFVLVGSLRGGHRPQQKGHHTDENCAFGPHTLILDGDAGVLDHGL